MLDPAVEDKLVTDNPCEAKTTKRPQSLSPDKRADGMRELRHFYASVLPTQGVSIKDLAEYPGHSDPGFTPRTYTRLVPSGHERAPLAINGVFGGSQDHGLEAA